VSFRALIVPRASKDGLTIIEDDVLESVAADLAAKGTVSVTDPHDDKHDCTVSDIEITERGIEANLTVLAIERVLNPQQPVPMTSMGSRVTGPEDCPVCKDKADGS
jgi:hypothetical protein